MFLLQVVFHAEIAQEAGRFDFNDVAAEVSEKLVRRHPHVFAQSKADTTDAVLAQWDKIKRREKGGGNNPIPAWNRQGAAAHAPGMEAPEKSRQSRI